MNSRFNNYTFYNNTIIMENDQQSCIGLDSVKDILMDPSIFICPVCFKIMQEVADIKECRQCQKLFCKRDYLKLSKKDVCPLCKMSPWDVSDIIHPIYAEMYSKLTYHCNFCSQIEKATYLQLQSHLEAKHNKILQEKWILNDYFVVYSGDEIVNLSPLQNVYVNYKLTKEQEVISIGDEGYDNFLIAVKGDKLRGKHSQNRKFELVPAESKSLRINFNYFVWEISMDKKNIMYAMPIQQILQAGYKKYQKQPIKNEILFDLEDCRYRISFSKMVQVNTTTGFKRNIKRLVISFK